MTLSYLEMDVIKSDTATGRGHAHPMHRGSAWARAAAAAWRAASAPRILPVLFRVSSALVLSYWLVQAVKHSTT